MLRISITILFISCMHLNMGAQLMNVKINEAPVVSQMMEKFVEINKAKTKIPGWRIQLLATTDRRKVEEEKARFQNLYPGMYVDWTHSNPYYKLRAGAFADRLDMYRMLNHIKVHFPSAYPARDFISPQAALN